MAKCHDGCAAGLGQKGLGSGHDSGYGRRCGKSILQCHYHDIVQHLALFNSGDPRLIVHKKHFNDTIAFFHQLCRIIASGDDAVNIFVSHFGHPLKWRSFRIAGHGAIFSLIVVKGILGAVQITDFAFPFYFIQLICFFFI